MVNYGLTIFFGLTVLLSNAQIKYPHLKGESFTYEQSIDVLNKLAKGSPYISIAEQGKTDVGRPLHTVVFNNQSHHHEILNLVHD